MAFEIAAGLASVVVQVVLPFVKQGAEKLAGQLSESVGNASAEAATGVAGRLWTRVKDALTSSGDAGVVEQFEKRPDASKELLEAALRERVQQDPQLAADLRALVDQNIEAGRDVVQIFGKGGVVTARDIHGGLVIGYAEQVNRGDE